MMATSKESCKACDNDGIKSLKFVPTPGAMAICPRCDRRKCGKCKNHVLDGSASRCFSCGAVLGLGGAA